MKVQSINNNYYSQTFRSKIHIEKGSVKEVGEAISNYQLPGDLNRTLNRLEPYHGNDVVSLCVKYLDDINARVLYAENTKTDVAMFEEFPSDATSEEKSNIVYRLLSDLADTELPMHDAFWGSNIYGKETMPDATEKGIDKSPLLHSIFY